MQVISYFFDIYIVGFIFCIVFVIDIGNVDQVELAVDIVVFIQEICYCYGFGEFVIMFLQVGRQVVDNGLVGVEVNGMGGNVFFCLFNFVIGEFKELVSFLNEQIGILLVYGIRF